MKKGYKRLLIFQLIIFFVLILNSFVSNILNDYAIIVFLLIILAFFKLIFGFEKDRHRHTKDIIFEICVFLAIYLLLFYLLGTIIGFARTQNYYNWYGLKNFIIPTVYLLIVKEILRYYMLTKSEGSKLLTITSCILFVLLDVTNIIYFNKFSSHYDSFIFIALYLLPAISKNIVFCYLTTKIGYKPLIVYLLITILYQYLLPIIPDPNKYLLSIINFLLPIIILYKINLFLKKDNDTELTRDYNKKMIYPLLVSAFVIAVFVYFTSGYFHYYTVAIASGSMNPKIKKGDIVVIEKIDKQYDKLKVGQVIAYKYDGVVVVHRMYKILKENDKYYFYTKGDANQSVDNYLIEEDMILGIVNIKIPYLGMPTVWLNEL